MINGKTAVITGGTKGIGFAIASALLEEGANVVISGRDDKGITKAIDSLSGGEKLIGIRSDVREEADVNLLIESCVDEFGGIDFLINNAGIGLFGKTVEEIEPEEFRFVIETNLFGVFYACHAVIPVMKKRGGGYIINISSLAGQNAHPRMSAYNASKFALNGFSESLMQEVRQDDIKVSYICPGSVNTEFGGDKIEAAKAWQLQPTDLSQLVVDLLKFEHHCLPSKIEIRPSKPPIN